MPNLLSSWQDLLGQFDLKVVFSVILLTFFAIVEILRGFDYLKNRRDEKAEKVNKSDDRLKTLETLEGENEASVKKLESDVGELKDSVELLLESDKCDIKAWITEKYHYYMDQGWIDDFTLDTIERRFDCYKKAGGNSYVQDLVNDLRKLRRINPSDPDKKRK